MYFGGRGTGPLPHNVSAFDVYLLAEQISAFGVNQGEVVNYGILFFWGNGEVKFTGVIVYARAIFEKLIVADLPGQAESIGKA